MAESVRRTVGVRESREKDDRMSGVGLTQRHRTPEDPEVTAILTDYTLPSECRKKSRHNANSWIPSI